MELASMLAGESFSDHPRTACPVVSMVLRCYNDGIDDERRDDLYWCASAVVGTRSPGSRAVRTERVARFFGVRLSRIEKLLPHVGRKTIGRAALAYARHADERDHHDFLSLIAELAGSEYTAAPDTTSQTAKAIHTHTRAKSISAGA
jgi:hypothetical protein